MNKYRHFIKTQRSRPIRGLGVAALTLLGLAIAPAALAQTYTLNTIATFEGTNGIGPNGLVVSGNTFYGTAGGGGDANNDGVVFSVPTTGGTPTVLASFNGANGSSPQSNLILSGNTLYGTTRTGGVNNGGTVFSVPISGGTPTVLASFTREPGSRVNDPNISGDLIVSGNTL